MNLSLLFATLVAAQLSARDCPELFGDDEAVAENTSVREKRLNFVMDGAPFVVVDHHHDWDEPEETIIEDIELIDTSTAGAKLLVQVDWTDCAPGVYEVDIDDSIGSDGQVLAILEDGVLLEYDGDLVYLLRDEETPIEWRMAWSSDYSMTPYLKKKSTTRSRRRARARKKRRRK